MKTVRSLVITGDGLNCEKETARALSLAGSESVIIHINDLLEKPEQLKNYDILALPGGFSFGDEINSGKVLALKIKYGLAESFKEFIDGQGLVIGICNGFQTLVKLGLLPNPFEDRILSLSYNKEKKFIDRWVEIKNQVNSPCVWTKNLPENFSLPVRHGEGRVVIKEGAEKAYLALSERGQVPLKYLEDINGSHDLIAGLCDPSGHIFGLMPHPEAAVSKVLNPYEKKELKEDVGMIFFYNAVEHIKNR